MKILTNYFLLLCAAFIVLVACSSNEGESTTDESASAFYNKNDMINFIIPFDPGGGADTSARLLSPYLTEYIEGNPKVQAENIPGAGTLNGTNEFARRDMNGMNMLLGTTSTTIPYLLGKKEVQYEISDWTPIFSIHNNGVVAISTNIEYEKIGDLLDFSAGELYYGTDDPTSGNMRYLLAFELLGLGDVITPAYGYNGSSERVIAMEQGEIDLDSGSEVVYHKSFAPMVDDGVLTPLFQFGYMNNEGDFEADPNIPAPTVQEVYRELYGEEPSGELWDAFKLFGGVVSQLAISPYIHEKDAPEAAIKALKEAASKVGQDNEFLTEADDKLGSNRFLTGDDLDNAYEQLKELSEPDTLNFVKKLLIEKYDAQGIE